MLFLAVQKLIRSIFLFKKLLKVISFVVSTFDAGSFQLCFQVKLGNRKNYQNWLCYFKNTQHSSNLFFPSFCSVVAINIALSPSWLK